MMQSLSHIHAKVLTYIDFGLTYWLYPGSQQGLKKFKTIKTSAKIGFFAKVFRSVDGRRSKNYSTSPFLNDLFLLLIVRYRVTLCRSSTSVKSQSPPSFPHTFKRAQLAAGEMLPSHSTSLSTIGQVVLKNKL